MQETNRQADRDTEILSKKSESLKYELASLKARLQQLESIANAAAKSQGKAGGAAVPSQVAERTTLLASKIDSSKRKLMSKLSQLAAAVNSVKQGHARLASLGAERCHADAAYLSLAREERKLGERVATLTQRHAQLTSVQLALSERTDSLARVRDDIYSEASTIQAYVQDAMHDPQKLLDVLPAVQGDGSTVAGGSGVDDDDALQRAAAGNGARSVLQRTGWSNAPSQAWGGILSGVAKAKAVAKKANTHDLMDTAAQRPEASAPPLAVTVGGVSPEGAPGHSSTSVRPSGTSKHTTANALPDIDERAAVGAILGFVAQGTLSIDSLPVPVQQWLGCGTDAAEAMRCALQQLSSRWSASSRRRFLAAEAYEALLAVQGILLKSHVVHRILKDAAARHVTLAAKPTLRALSSSKPMPPPPASDRRPPRPQSAAGRAAAAVSLLHANHTHQRRPSTAQSTGSRVTFAQDTGSDSDGMSTLQEPKAASGEAAGQNAPDEGDGASDYGEDSYESMGSPHAATAEGAPPSSGASLEHKQDSTEDATQEGQGDLLALASMQVAVPDTAAAQQVQVWDGASIELATDQMERQAAQTISLQQQRQLLLQFQTVLIRMLRRLQGSGDSSELLPSGEFASGQGDGQPDEEQDVVRALVDESDSGAGSMSQQHRTQHAAGIRASAGGEAPLHLLLDQLTQAQDSSKPSYDPPRLIHGKGGHQGHDRINSDPYGGDFDWEGGHGGGFPAPHATGRPGQEAGPGRAIIRDAKGTPLINVSSRMSAHERAQMAQLDSSITRLHMHLQGLQRKEGMLQQVTEKVRKNTSFATVFSVLAGLYGHKDQVLLRMQGSPAGRVHSADTASRPGTAASMLVAAGRPNSQQSAKARGGSSAQMPFGAVHTAVRAVTPIPRAVTGPAPGAEGGSDASYSDEYDSDHNDTPAEPAQQTNQAAPGVMQCIAGDLSIPFPWSAATLSLYLTEVELTARELGSAPDALREAGLL